MKYILAGFALRFLIAIWNGFFGPSFGAEGDALLFHDIAVQFSQFGLFDQKFNIGWIYSMFLGSIYFLTVNSIFIGSFLSCLAWLISALVLNKIIKLLGVQKKYRDLALMAYAFLPSSILFTSVTLREVYQLLFVNLLIYSSLMILVKKNRKFWFLLLLSSVGMALLHFGLVFYGILGAILTFYFSSVRGNRAFSLELVIFYMPAGALLIYLGLSLFNQLVPYDFSEGIAAAVQAYQAGHNEARAMYVYQPEIDGLLDLLLFMPISFLQYLIEPLPWRIATPLDLALFIENFFRLVLIYYAISNLTKVHGFLQTHLFFLIVMFVSLEMLWALGTVNWGSAVRHHIPALGILAIIGICFLDKNLHAVTNLRKKRKVAKS
ncbi:hypothetical protein N9R25_03545 [Gammaproteobacteria bacterium]|nr:hypothetical protein [Gammaproteobacteria bacterium]